MKINFRLRNPSKPFSSLYARLTIDGIRGAEFSIFRKIESRHWNQKVQSYDEQANDHKVVALKLMVIKNELETIALQFQLSGTAFSSSDVLKIYLKKEKSLRLRF